MKAAIKSGKLSLVLVGAMIAVLLLPAIPANAAPMTVAAGLVAAGNDGACSLREAIGNAEADAQNWADCPAGSGADVITLPEGTYNVNDTIRMGDGSAFQISSDVTLIGAGPTRPRLDAGSSSRGDWRRHFHVHPGGTLQLENLTLQDGSASGPGGAIFNEGNVDAVGVRFVNNHANWGGAVANWCTYPCTSEGQNNIVVATDSLFRRNSASSGGAINNDDGELTLVNSTLRSNRANVGSAIYAHVDGTTTINRSLVALNEHLEKDNEADAVVSQGTLTVTASTIRDNDGSGIGNNTGSATIVKSTISGNAGRPGGGVWSLARYHCSAENDCIGHGASLTIRDSTITGNKAFGADSGGGIWSSDFTSIEEGQTARAVLKLTNVTITGNTSPAGAQVWAAGAHVRNTVIGQVFGVASCDQTDDNVSWTGHNNFTDDGSCTSGGFTDANSPLLLSPLADNGGPTLTQMPHPASPVIGAGDQATCDWGSKRVSANTDQRGTGFPRTVGSSCDVGAVEAGIQKLLAALTLDVGDLRFQSGSPRGNEGLRASLREKLDAAMDAVDRNNYEAASGQLGAFQNQVAAHEGKRIAEADADRLIMGAEAIVGLFPSGEHPPEPV